jgi:NDP-sugar pyrophosphorylase family protein
MVLDGYFIDIGLPEDLARAQREIPQRRGSRAADRGEGLQSRME